MHPLYITVVAAAPLHVVVAVALVRAVYNVPLGIVTSVDVNSVAAVYGFIAIVTVSYVLELLMMLLLCCCC